MKKNLLKAVVFLAVMGALSSCNRGVGCPSDFSADLWSTLSNTLSNLF